MSIIKILLYFIHNFKIAQLRLVVQRVLNVFMREVEQLLCGYILNKLLSIQANITFASKSLAR